MGTTSPIYLCSLWHSTRLKYVDESVFTCALPCQWKCIILDLYLCFLGSKLLTFPHSTSLDSGNRRSGLQDLCIDIENLRSWATFLTFILLIAIKGQYIFLWPYLFNVWNNNWLVQSLMSVGYIPSKANFWISFKLKYSLVFYLRVKSSSFDVKICQKWPWISWESIVGADLDPVFWTQLIGVIMKSNEGSQLSVLH